MITSLSTADNNDQENAQSYEEKVNRNEQKIEKMHETKSLFLENIYRIDKSLAILIKKKGRSLKSIKLETKKEKLQLTPQKYKGP